MLSPSELKIWLVRFGNEGTDYVITDTAENAARVGREGRLKKPGLTPTPNATTVTCVEIEHMPRADLYLDPRAWETESLDVPKSPADILKEWPSDPIYGTADLPAQRPEAIAIGTPCRVKFRNNPRVDIAYVKSWKYVEGRRRYTLLGDHMLDRYPDWSEELLEPDEASKTVPVTPIAVDPGVEENPAQTVTVVETMTVAREAGVGDRVRITSDMTHQKGLCGKIRKIDKAVDETCKSLLYVDLDNGKTNVFFPEELELL